MKKIITLSALLVITGSAIMAQKTSFGIKGGIQQTALAEKIEEGDTKIALEAPRAGFVLGGVADIKFSSNFSVQPNLLFVYRPSKLIIIEAGEINSMSIDIPINLNYNNNGFFIGAGPNFSYGITSKFQAFGDDEKVDLYEKVDGEDAPFKRFEIGVNGQLGYQFPSGLTISANYTRGFNNIINMEGGGDEIKMNNKMFGLSIGYMFNCSAKAKK